MATFLEQGIDAAKKGQKARAKALFQQVLLADDRNERAWLWMSEMADSPIERIACIERALAINPGNKTTQLALQSLKTQLTPQIEPVAALAEAATTAKETSPVVTPPHKKAKAPRKPFKLKPKPASNGQAVYHQNTVAMPAMVGAFGGPAQSVREIPAIENASLVENLDSLPLLPTVLFGTLTISAVTGVFLIIMLAVFA